MRDSEYKLKQKKKRAEQQKRRRKNQQESLDIGMYVPLIRTGEPTRWPAAYCTHYHGFMTLNIMRVHKCECKNCPHLHKDIDKYLCEF